jgi:cold shock CspA family protein
VERATGTVTAFDDPRGIGTVTTDDGRPLLFHCTAIADGTRTIAVGAPVVVDVVAGLPGQWEAAAIRLRTGEQPSA